MECLENAAVYVVANLCQPILTIEFLEEKRSEDRSMSNQLLLEHECSYLNIPEEGAYTRDIISDPAYKPPPTFSTSAKVAKQGAYMRDTTVSLYLHLNLAQHA